MFARVAKGGLLKTARRLSSDSGHSELESWITTYKNMRVEAKEIAESAVGGTKSEVSSLRSEMRVEIASVKSDMTVLKSEVNILKSDVHSLVQGQVELHKQINDVHKQMSNNTRTILVTIVGVAGAFFAANRYLDDKNDNKVAPKI